MGICGFLGLERPSDLEICEVHVETEGLAWIGTPEGL